MFSPKHTPAFDLAWHFVAETSDNIFLTGKAGTGKTTFLKYLLEHEPKRMAVAAPTGVAAINAGGVTLHSMFHLPFGPFIPDKPVDGAYDRKTLLSQLRYNHDKVVFFQTLELLVIDEVSMVSSYLLDAIDTILRWVRHRNDLPFGGVQLLFIGDLYQLQPVVKPDEWQILKNHYTSIFFFDSHVLRNNLPVIIELKEIFRQHDDSFIEILNGIRDNNISKENLERLNERLNRNFKSVEGDGYITLTTHNNQADSINQLRLRTLPSKSEKYIAETKGDFPEHMFPAEKELVLKEGAQVMFIRNETETKKYFNGKIGVVSALTDEEIVVRCDGEDITVHRHEWENTRYTTDSRTKEIKHEVLGTFSQYPLRLAWAITIHKSQGLTFNKLIVDAENAFVKGQVYVALSRATAIEGLVLSTPVNDHFLGAHESLSTLYEKQLDENSLQQLFEKSKQKNLESQLLAAFSFEPVHYALTNLKKPILELELVEISQDWMNQLKGNVQTLRDVTSRFGVEIRNHLNNNSAIEENEKLQQRIVEASKYFSKCMNELTGIFLNHPFKTNNRSVSKKLDKYLKQAADVMKEASAKIDCCVSGFRMNEFLKWKKRFTEIALSLRTSYSDQPRKKEETPHLELSDRLKEFRNTIEETEEVPVYMIFSNTAIRNCCEMLPGDKDSLLEVSGFGKKKMEQFGKEVIEIVLEYCKSKDLIPKIIAKDEKKNKDIFRKVGSLSPTVTETIELFRSGKNVDEIVAARKLVTSTIEGHLAVGIRNRMVDIHNILKQEEIDEMKMLFDLSSGHLELALAREKSNSKFSYGKLKMVQSWLVSQLA